MATKILVCGDIEGNFDTIFSKVRDINRSHGPFRALFCVGNFFSLKTDDFSGAADADSELWITGKKSIPVPTYFIDGSSGTDIPHSIQRHGGEICPGIIFLGRYGVREIDHLNVAFLNGVYDPFCYKAASSQSITSYTENEIKSFAETLETKYKNKIDILLTAEWPEGICNNLSSTALPPSLRQHNRPRHPSIAVQHVVRAASPRYHFVGTEGLFMERAPYSNPSSQNITRFISLGKIPSSSNESNESSKSSKSKTPERFLYAAGMRPIANTSGIPPLPQNTTPSPFQQIILSSSSSRKRNLNNNNSNNSNNNDSNNNDLKGTKKDEEETFKRPPPTKKRRKNFNDDNSKNNNNSNRHVSSSSRKEPTPCWFCMSSTTFASHLVTSIGDHCYVTLPKGGLTRDHVLIVPIEHVASTAALSTAAVKEMEVVKDALRKMFRERKEKTVLFYERNCWSSKQATQAHLQIQVIPIPFHDNNENENENENENNNVDDNEGNNFKMKESKKSNECASKFEIAGKEKDIEFSVVSSQISFLDAVKETGCNQSQYLAIELPDRSKMIHRISRDKKHPLQFARTVCADILGMPERADWRKCALSQDEEKKITEQFRQDLKSYDVLL